MSASSDGGAFIARGNASVQGEIQFATTDGSYTNYTERMRIDSSGRVLIGLSSSSAEASLILQGSSTGIGDAVLWINRGAAPSTTTAGAELGKIKFGDIDQNVAVEIEGERDGGTWTSGVSHPGRLLFKTTADGAADPTERMRIDSSGNVGIGTDSPYVFTQVEGQLMATGSADQFQSEQKVLIFGRKGRAALDRHNYISSVVDFTVDGDNKLLFYVNDAAGTGHTNTLTLTGAGNVGIGTDSPTTELDVNGEVTAIDYNSTSDIRLKTNIQVVKDPLEKVLQINGVSFNWKKDNRPSLGVIADNIQEVLPELVSDGNPKTVNYNGLIGLLIEVVKEQQSQIDSLNNRLSKLE
jgi:hypothetical protein